MEGNLYKWTNYISGWKERYFYIQGSTLHYTLNKGEKDKGTINLSTCTVNIDKINELKFEIDSGTNVFYLMANYPTERNNWVEAINKAISLDSNNQKKTKDWKDDKLLNRIYLVKKQSDKLVHNNDNFNKIMMRYEGIFAQEKECFDELKLLFGNYKELENNLSNNVAILQNYTEKFSQKFKVLSEFIIDQKSNENENRHEDQFGSFSKSKSETININLNAKRNSSFRIVNVIEEKAEIFYEAQEEESLNKDESDDQEKYQETQGKIVDNVQAISTYQDKCYLKKRHKFPVAKKAFPFNVWQILKDAVGKDLSKFCVPVYFNEPLSFLQRLCENFQYAYLLNQAGQDENRFKRLAFIAAYCMGGYSMHPGRTLKPFNPLLGETYEYIDPDMKFKFFAEQVSHHPPISACHAESDYFTLYTNSDCKSKLSLIKNCLEFTPTGRTFIKLKKFDELITYTKPLACVRGLIIGKMRVDCYGKVLVKNHNTGDYCELNLFEEGMFNDKDKGKILGGCYDSNSNLMIKIEGNWQSHLDCIMKDSNGHFNIRENIWRKTEVTGVAEEKYFLTDFSINLNNLTEEMKDVLPKTDTRFRPDQRALEMQDLEFAANEKHRLEEKQREVRKSKQKQGISHKPIYFEETYDETNSELIYIFSRDYWKDREEKNYEHLPDIY